MYKLKFEDDDEAVKMANDTLYGLAASVFSLNIKRALSVAHRIQAGTVGVRYLFWFPLTVASADLAHFCFAMRR